MSVWRKARIAFDDWVLEPPYREPRLPWRWHLAWLTVFIVGSLAGPLITDTPQASIAVLLLLVFLLPTVRRAYVKEHPASRLDGRSIR